MLHSTLYRPLVLALLLAAAGCSATGPHSGSSALEMRLAAAPRTLAIVDGRDGSPLGWNELVSRAAGADVVFIGEQHNDAVGHAVEAALVRDLLAENPDFAVCLEMLERDEQGLVDDHLDGIIDAPTFEKLTLSTNWGGKGRWSSWYQPIVDAAADAGAPVVAANAPRRYVRLARTEGYERLDTLPADRRAFVDRPDEILEGPYQDRFREMMDTGDEEAHGGGMVDDLYRAQLVWDTTMAASIVGALDRGASGAVLIVGQFHSDFEGGTVQQLRALRPDLRILVVSMVPSDSTVLEEEDRGRADAVVYTRGERD